MKIVCLAYLHGFGGAEKQIIMLANAMAQRNLKVTLISISDDNFCFERNSKVEYIFLPDRRKDVFRVVSRYNDLKRVLKRLRPDITVNFWYQSTYMTALMSKRITGKIIYSERGDPGDCEYTGLLGCIRKFTLPLIDGFVFQSEGARDYFCETVQKRSVIIHNPIFFTVGKYKIPEMRKKQIISVGRLHPQKNQKLLIEAFAFIASEISDYSLEIYGDGELKETLLKQIKQAGLENRVHIRKSTKEILERMNESSLFVLSSDYEGMPNVLMEAMALGLPCISTDCRPGGARTLIEDGINGYIVPVDDVQSLADKIKFVLTHYASAQKTGLSAMKIIDTHTESVIYDKWADFFMKITGE